VPILTILYMREMVLAILFKSQGGRPTKHKGGRLWAQRGLAPGMQGGSFASKPGGIMEVAMWLAHRY
jgi:hypothetical protein